MARDPLDQLGPISQSAIENVAKIEAAERRTRTRRHAGVEVSEDKSVTVEAGGTGDKLTWTAWAKKVYRGPWTAGSSWRW